MTEEVKEVVIKNNLDGHYAFFCFKGNTILPLLNKVTPTEMYALRREINEMAEAYERGDLKLLQRKGIK